MRAFFKISFVLMLIGIIFYSSAHKSWILLSYHINKLEIIEKFCVNKEETTFKCDGQCHLKTELKTADEQDENPLAVTSENNSITWYTIEFKTLECKKQVVKSTPFAEAPIVKEQEFINTIFHPPKV